MRALLLALLLLAPAAARAARVLVVVADPLPASSREALDGFLAEWGETVDIASSGRAIPSGNLDVVIAFGANAAARARKAGVPMVVALAPAYRPGGTKTVLVAMTPSPESFASYLAAAGVRRLLAVRTVTWGAEFQRRAAEAGRRLGVDIEDGVLSSPAELPRLLRRLGGSVDGIWLAPDPSAVTPHAFSAAQEFSRDRGIPFFAPAAGLVSDGVRGELAVSFHGCGMEAARAAREILSGRSVAAVVYPSRAAQGPRVVLSTQSFDQR